MPSSPFSEVLERVEQVSRFHYAALRAIDMRVVDAPGYACVYLNEHNKRIVIELTNNTLKMPLDDQAFVVMHEVEHVLRSHLVKPSDKHHRLWNIAGDCLINSDLADDYSRKLRYSLDFYKNLFSKDVFNIPDECNTIELVYNFLDKNRPDLKSSGHGEGSGDKKDSKKEAPGDGQKNNGVGNSTAQSEDIKYIDESDADEFRDAVREIANRIAEGRGFESAPSRFKNLLTKRHEKKLDWRNLMQNAFRVLKPDLTITYSKINNRKYISTGIVSPGRKLKGLPNVYVMIDTSGSCEAAAPFFLEELNNILEDTGLEVEGCFLDTQMYPFGRINKVTEELTNNVKGGGGTDFRQAYEYLLKQETPYDLVIMMTDCLVDGPKEPIANRTIVFTIHDENFLNGSCPGCEIYKVKIEPEEL